MGQIDPITVFPNQCQKSVVKYFQRINQLAKQKHGKQYPERKNIVKKQKVILIESKRSHQKERKRCNRHRKPFGGLKRTTVIYTRIHIINQHPQQNNQQF